jgi:copper chaperone CopZ
MSRRRGEFEHRTSIFEGAFRAWSHLGGLEPEDLESKPASDLDPLTNPITSDTRAKGNKADRGEGGFNPDGSKRWPYPYEPLPRSGLAHPYVQAILSPWLGPDADNDAIQLGLTTLRTWWQHRRKGESGSAVAALGTEKMKGVVEGYTRHFFTLAHCLIMNDKEQPPRTLHGKMKDLEKMRSKRSKKRAREEEAGKIHLMAMSSGVPDDPKSVAARITADLTDTNLTPLERLHAAQRRQLAVEGGVNLNPTTMAPPPDAMTDFTPGGNDSSSESGMTPATTLQIINIKNKCMPQDLKPVVEAVNLAATQLAHRGGGAGVGPAKPLSSSGATPSAVPSAVTSVSSSTSATGNYGDPETAPVVFVSENSDILLAMLVDGITCAHCVKIVETVLKGCNGNKSPIDGLVDAAADRVLCSVLIKIDKTSNAKRIAFEAARNLAMVGYTAKAKEMGVSMERDGKKVTDMDVVNNAFDMCARADPKDIFDWSIPCSCPDNGVLRDDCAR